MTASHFRAALVALTLAAAATQAQAVTCYVVYDRTENVIYRDVIPPVDLSDAGAQDRDAMRRRGETMLFMESESCPRLEFFTGGAGNIGLRLDEALAPSADTAAPATATTEPKAAPSKGPAKPAAQRSARKPAAG